VDDEPLGIGDQAQSAAVLLGADEIPDRLIRAGECVLSRSSIFSMDNGVGTRREDPPCSDVCTGCSGANDGASRGAAARLDCSSGTELAA
jgi:hypothetical protein